MKKVKNIMKYQVYKKKSMILSCNILMICLDFFAIQVEYCKFLNLFGSYVLLYELFISIFSLFSRTLPLKEMKYYYDLLYSNEFKYLYLDRGTE